MDYVLQKDILLPTPYTKMIIKKSTVFVKVDKFDYYVVEGGWVFNKLAVENNEEWFLPLETNK